MYKHRREKLQTEYEVHQIDAVLIKNPYNLRYYSGYTGGNGYLLIAREKVYLITDLRYFEQVTIECPDIIVLDAGQLSYAKGLGEALQKEGIQILGFEEDSITYQEYTDICAVCDGMNLMPKSEWIVSQRQIKTQEEIEKIGKAEAIAGAAFSHILASLKAGITEKEIAFELECHMKKQGAEALSFDMIIASGTHSSMPHARVTQKPVEAGEFIIMDFGCIYEGYCSDMTRTVAIGKISNEMQDVYNIVLEAQLTAMETIKPGMICSEIDAIARDIIKKYGYGEYFGHGLGHGVGLDIHESPRFSLKCDTVLVPNMVLTVEPGIYLPGKFGVRIEDLIVVTKGGFRNLTTSLK